MCSDTSQGSDCCWAFATAVYSRTSDRSGMRRLWYSLRSYLQPWTLWINQGSHSTGRNIIFFVQNRGIFVYSRLDGLVSRIRPPRTATGWSCKSEELIACPLLPAAQTVISTFQGLAPGTHGGLDRGSPMLHVGFKKWSCPCHYFCNIHVNYKMIPYPMSILRNNLCLSPIFVLVL